MRQEPKDRRDFAILKLFLSLVLWGASAIHQFLMDKNAMVSISGASAEELSYWGTKGAVFALIAAATLFVALIPTRNQLANVLPMTLGALSAIGSGFYWLQESTNGHAGAYSAVFLVAGVIIGISILMGPGFSIITENLSRIRVWPFRD